jgi:protein-L-isoaspartate(D-aspartate) O-methyltransferase
VWSEKQNPEKTWRYDLAPHFSKLYNRARICKAKLPHVSTGEAAMNLEQARFNMIEQQIRTWEVLDQRVLDVLARVPRDAFVPPAYRGLAYADVELPLGEGEVMMAPRVEARMLQSLRLTRFDRVLEVGTGSGFVAALIARLAGQVVSVERLEAFSQQAGARLAAQGIQNVTLRVGDASRGWPDQEPYDAIAVTGSVPRLGGDFQHQLKVGGRLFVVVGEAPAMEALLITRVGEQDWSRESLFETVLPPLRGLPPRQRFVF